MGRKCAAVTVAVLRGAPYATAALEYQEFGWYPLPVAGKYPPPTGWTGHDAPYPTYADVFAWTEDKADWNIGLRMASTMLGVDVDAYGDKRGRLTLAECELRWGELPPTWRSTNRDDGVSAIRYFTVPGGLHWPGQLPGGGVELIHSGHRYAMAPPSLHPEGRPYRWLQPNGTASLTKPRPEWMPLLPPGWIVGLVRPPRTDVHAPAPPGWLTGLPTGEPCSELRSVLLRLQHDLAGGGGRHDAALEGVLALVRLGQQGHPGAAAALNTAGHAFRRAVADSRTDTEAAAEWERMLHGAAELVAGNPGMRLRGDPCRIPLAAALWGGQVRAEPTTERNTPRNPPPAGNGRLTATPAAGMPPQRTDWLWDNRIPLGMLTLLAGPQALGKSTLAYWLAAQVSRGLLPGTLHGAPRSVLVTSTEDSWPHVIVPRLMAMGADLTRVHRLEVADDTGSRGLVLPADLVGLPDLARRIDAVLLIMDPMVSRLGGRVDTHRDGDVRAALEPLVAALQEAGLAGLGLAHLSKTTATSSMNVLERVMGSLAFTAVARAVLAVLPDPEVEDRRLLGLVKCSVGRTDIPNLAFRLANHRLEIPNAVLDVAQLEWDTSAALPTVSEAMAAGQDLELRGAVKEAAEWLTDFLDQEGSPYSADVKKAAGKAGISEAAVKRAATRLGVVSSAEGFPRRTTWRLPVANGGEPTAMPQSDQPSPQTSTVGPMFAPTEPT